MSPSLDGTISDKLRKIFSRKSKAWTPQRPKESTKMPKSGVQGVSLSKGGRRTRK
jgi:hypothetical protein